MRRRFMVAFAALVALLAMSAAAYAADEATTPDDTLEVGADYNKGHELPLLNPETNVPEEVGPDFNAGKPLPLADGPRATQSRRALQASQVGDVKTWLALDDAMGFIYLKDYELRAIGDNIEVWVATDLTFPAGDCRNDERVEITDEQVAYLVEQFDGNIYPKESAAFSVPPARDGSNAALDDLVGLPADYYTGEGEDIVALIDNVRDDNYYDTNNANEFSYIAGFFYSVFNEYFDRNVMSIDVYDWLHRTTANPPNEPVPGDPCASKPARPFLYEGVFAHEYQHLLEYYEDPGELNWINEGLADWAQTLTGYVDPSIPITETGYDSHIQCFLGWLGVQTDANPNPRGGGPENSLTLWGDQGDGEILCDYGAAYTMMEFLAGRYGQDFMSELHRNDGHGFAGLDATLDASGSRDSAQDVFDDWTVMVAIDGILDAQGRINGRDRDFQTPTLHAVVNPNTEDAYSTPGAPPNGSDYVRFRDADGNYLEGDDVDSLSFDGASTLPTLPVEWTVDSTPPADTTDLLCPAAPASTLADPAFYSGCGPNFDRAIVHEVTVPASDPTLTFDTLYSIETGWDFGFVQVSTDGGTTWTSLGNADTTSDHDPGAIPAVQENVPGFSGDSGGWITTSFDLSAYSGETILLAFRYITDPGVDEAGWWVDDVAVGGTVLSDGSDLAGWQSPSEVNPAEVAGFTVKLISYRVSRHGKVTMEELRLDSEFDFSSDRARRFFDRHADVVGAIVTYNDPSETSNQYAPYTLTVNGVVQPGGS